MLMVRVHEFLAWSVIGVATVATMAAAPDQQPPAPAPGQPSQAPALPAAPAAPGQPAAPVATTPPQPRIFNAPAGLLFNTVRPERVADFEKVMAYLQAAFEKSSDDAVRAQARGWHIFKATEAGPSNTVLYVYFIDPTVMGADYGIGKILADAYPEQVAEIWKLYTSSVTGGGSLLNLAPVKPVTPPPLTPVVPQKP
jgi:hypothetical protein